MERPRTTGKCYINIIMGVKVIMNDHSKGRQRGNPSNIKEMRWGNKLRAPPCMNKKLSRFTDIRSKIILNSSFLNVIEFQRYRRMAGGRNKEKYIVDTFYDEILSTHMKQIRRNNIVRGGTNAWTLQNDSALTRLPGSELLFLIDVRIKTPWP